MPTLTWFNIQDAGYIKKGKKRDKKGSDSEAPRRKKAKKKSTPEARSSGTEQNSSDSEDIEPLKTTLEKEVQRILKNRQC